MPTTPATPAEAARRVPPKGPLDAKIAFVGEAPGEQEARLGEPFVGMSGQLLTRLMNDAGISRQSVYLTNVVKERPPNNNIAKFINLTDRSVVATEAYKAYVEELRQELTELKPNVAVAVGRVALYALTGKHDRITKRRGSIYESTLVPGLKVIPIIHPSAALRQYEFTQLIQFDLFRIKEEAKTPELGLPERDIRLAPTFEEALGWLLLAQGASYLSFDIEVIKTAQDYEVSCIGFCDGKSTISIPLVDERGDYFNPDQEADIWVAIAKLLEADQPSKITQNGVFDFHFLFRKYGIRCNVHHDTMIAMAYINPDVPKGLDFIASVYTKEPYYKDDGKIWFKLGGKYRDLWLYNARDAAVTYDAFFPMMRDIARMKNSSAYQLQVDLIPALVYMQERGMLVNLGDVSELATSVREKLYVLEQALEEVAGCQLNINSSAQLQDYFYQRKKVKPYISRTTGNPTVDVNALKRLKRKGFKEAELILEMRALTKLKSTYLDMKLDPDSRFRCSFNPVGTVNSRLSSSKNFFGTGGNAQNLPKSFRKFMVADPGYVMYQFDLGQAENRTVAYIAPEPTMINAFESKVDMHRLTASMIFGVQLADVTDEQRQWGKRANHGLNYDLGYKKFAFIYEIDEADAKYIVERYHMTYPGVRQFHAWVQHKLRQDRTLTNLFGRSRRFTDRWGQELFKAAYDYIPQSSVATKLNRDGVLELWRRQDLYAEAELLNQVHDSVVFQIPISAGFRRHAEILMSLKAALEAPLEWKLTKFSIPADLKMGLNFGVMEDVPADEFQSIERLDNFLFNLHTKLRASNTLSPMDRRINYCGGDAEEMLTEMGDTELLP